MPPKKSAALKANGQSLKKPRLPGIKHNAPSERRKTTFNSDSDSDDDTTIQEKEPKPQASKAAPAPLKKSRSILGSQNVFKQLLSHSQEERQNDPPLKRGPGRPAKKKKPQPQPEAPVNQATTPRSLLKQAKDLLRSSDDRKSLHFDDIENEPEQELPRRRSPPSPTAKRAKKQPAPSLPKRRKRQPKNLNNDKNNNPEYVEQASQHTLGLTGDDESSRPTGRSSYTNRGKRVLSIGNGFVAKPHEDMSERDYYKVVDSTLPEPSRMRQLLVWCFKKKLQQDKESEAAGETYTAKGIAKVIQTELLDELVAGKISTSWYSKQDHEYENLKVTGKRIVKSNPLNESNKESIRVFTQKLKELRQEKQHWQNAFVTSVKPLEGLSVNESNGEMTPALQKYLDEKKATSMKDVLGGSSLADLQQHVTEAKEQVPGKLERLMALLYHTVYQLSRSVDVVNEVEKEAIAPQLQEKMRQFMDRDAEGMARLTQRELLRGITRVDCQRGVQ